jgi:hypothetical protein
VADLRGPSVCFGIPVGPFGVPLVCPQASFRALWVPLASLGGRLGVPLGYLWGVFGCFGVTWAAWDCPGVPGDAENRKTHVFVCFCPCIKKQMFLCVSRGGQGSMQQNTRVFVCFRVFEAEVAPNQNIRIFVCFWSLVFGKHVFLWVRAEPSRLSGTFPGCAKSNKFFRKRGPRAQAFS